MDKNDIDLLLAGRAIVDSYIEQTGNLDDSNPVQSAQHTAATNKMMAGLKALGFSIFQAFTDFNELMCIQALSELPFGICDKCSGVKGDPPCIQRYGSNACFYRSDIESYRLSGAKLKHILNVLRARKYTPDDDELNLSVCPKGHGWRVKVADYNNLSFDITWGDPWLP